jgi:hypothetical protein
LIDLAQDRDSWPALWNAVNFLCSCIPVRSLGINLLGRQAGREID